MSGRVLQRNIQDNGEKGEMGAGRRESGEEKGRGIERERERREGREGERDHKKSAHRIPEADKHWLAGSQLKGHQHPITPGGSGFLCWSDLCLIGSPPTLGGGGGDGGSICLTQATSSHPHLVRIFTDTPKVLVHRRLYQNTSKWTVDREKLILAPDSES